MCVGDKGWRINLKICFNSDSVRFRRFKCTFQKRYFIYKHAITNLKINRI